MQSTAAHHALLADTLAQHFEHATVRGNEIDLGLADVLLRCRVHALHDVGEQVTAHLFFDLRGGELGNDPIFISAAGYGARAEDAIVSGAADWAKAFAPVLHASLGGHGSAAYRFDVEVDGHVFHAAIDGLDRALLDANDPEGTDPLSRTRAARERFGATPWLSRILLESGRMPLLAANRASVLSVFVFDAPDKRVIEIKVNGRDWPAANSVLEKAPKDPTGHRTMLRELCVLVPMGEPTPLSRDTLLRTLGGLAQKTEGHLRDAVAWTGWRAHGGDLAAPLSPAALHAFEATIGVTLPADYAVHLTQIAGGGAGPGYGVLSPLHDAQKALVKGELTWTDGGPRSPPQGALALAYAGCGNMWLLAIRGTRAGEVWLDAAGSDQKVHRVASSFEAWYREWIDVAVRDVRPYHQWNPQFCAARTAFSQLLATVPTGSSLDAPPSLAGHVSSGTIAITSQETPYFAAGAIVDPCQACCSLATQLGLDASVFKAGVAPRQAPERSLLGRLFKR